MFHFISFSQYTFETCWVRYISRRGILKLPKVIISLLTQLVLCAVWVCVCVYVNVNAQMRYFYYYFRWCLVRVLELKPNKIAWEICNFLFHFFFLLKNSTDISIVRLSTQTKSVVDINYTHWTQFILRKNPRIIFIVFFFFFLKAKSTDSISVVGNCLYIQHSSVQHSKSVPVNKVKNNWSENFVFQKKKKKKKSKKDERLTIHSFANSMCVQQPEIFKGNRIIQLRTQI